MCNYKSSVQDADIRYINGIIRNFLMDLGVRIAQVDLDDLEQNCAKRWVPVAGKHVRKIAKRKTLLATVVVREIQDFLKKRKRHREERARNIYLDECIGGSNDTFQNLIPNFKFAADRKLLEAELEEKLSDAVQKLTPALKEIYDLIEEIGELDLEEFSKSLHISMSNVYERLFRLRKFLIKEGLMDYLKKSRAFPYFWQRSRTSPEHSDSF